MRLNGGGGHGLARAFRCGVVRRGIDPTGVLALPAGENPQRLGFRRRGGAGVAAGRGDGAAVAGRARKATGWRGRTWGSWHLDRLRHYVMILIMGSTILG